MLLFLANFGGFPKKNEFNHATRYYIVFSSPLEIKCYKRIYQSHNDWAVAVLVMTQLLVKSTKKTYYIQHVYIVVSNS